MPLKSDPTRQFFKATIRRKKPGKKSFIRRKAFAFAKSEDQARRFIKRRHPGFQITRIEIN